MENDIIAYACRVCLARNVEVASLFTTSINSIILSEMFSTIVPMIEINDTVPHSICTNCIANLVVAYEFQLQSIKADSDIRIALGHLIKEDELKDHIFKDEVTVEVLVADVGNIETTPLNNFESTESTAICKDSNNSENCIDDRAVSSIGDQIISSKANAKLSENSINQKRSKCIATHQCLECDKSFDKLSRLQRHAKIHNADGKPFSCDSCPQRFASSPNLLRHQIKHSNEMALNTTTVNNKPNSFQCNECQKVFTKQESLASHMKMHKSDQKEYFCEFCPKSFSKMNKLTRHAKIHDEMKSHKCNICERTFALGGQLIDHMNKHKNLKPHVCTYCNKGFQQSCTLKDHIRIHTRDAPFLCSECGKAFNNGSNLRQHLLRHSGLKPFECTECPSRFSCKGGLKSHMSTHSGIKPYCCEVCGASFTKTYSLAKHKRIHSGEKPYKCDMCDMRFNSSDHVKRHMRTHSGEKPYKCQYCDRAFAQSNDLVKHTRSHVGMNTYKCDQCPAAFRLHGELRVHRQQHFLERKSVSVDQPSQKCFQDVRSDEDTKNINEQLQNLINDSKQDIRFAMLQLETSIQPPSQHQTTDSQFMTQN
ncbi:Zinc finger protein [Pseudolycoriella hygida]|uniref:Zinc finger protein n=1 Tax=Pseudolycoriella hygida TaxID=35572 RepID=A0A9Q0RV80_9DIPT|nr:Zinc finger protein [Pseudolycoriella hygida]